MPPPVPLIPPAKNSPALTRREALALGARLTTLGALASSFSAHAQGVTVSPKISRREKIVVVGAGAFGGWSALHLLRQGCDVTLVDQFGPGNNQASSGGETRLLRILYGTQQLYFDLAVRSAQLWRENERRFGKKIFHQIGMAIFSPTINESTEAAIPLYRRAGLTFEKLSPAEASRRWPQVRTDDLAQVYFDPQSGFLRAREGCEVVRDAFIAEGGTFVRQKAVIPDHPGATLTHVLTAGGGRIEADRFLIAGGPWLIRIFPEIAKKLIITRQIEFFFATPPDASDLMENRLPTWSDRDPTGKSRGYGVPGNAFRGFKAAYELRDDITDRFEHYDRFYQPKEVQHMREVLANRFPRLKDAPFIEGRVCQYTETPDLNFILDVHPARSNVWILGGGSGHGYKHGAALGELTARVIFGQTPAPELFALKRLLA